MAADATGRPDPALEAPPLPSCVTLVWHAFEALHGARGSGGFGPSAIGHADLVAWERLAGVRLTPWEADTLLAMDRAALAAVTKD